MACSSTYPTDMACMVTTKGNEATFVVATPGGNSENIADPIPKIYKKNINGPDEIQWQKAVEEEPVQTMKMRVWTPVPQVDVLEKKLQ
jgi:hypothetical protein